ncbi:unnamed protein product, partial [Onchocerca flexuosa]|uniref:C2H2-type domain-containing protein n=1 Tax=Onchocerca flexuosa TaxID=387005 RepID=A0A183HY17_9BILA
QHAAASLAGRIRAPPQVPTSRTQLGGTISSGHNNNVCEICDQNVQDRDRYLTHLQLFHKQMRGKTSADMQQGAPLACSRCRDRFWTYEGLERHLVMAHGLVTSDLLTKAQKKEDGGRCKHCGKQYAFNMLQHLVTDHQVKLCSAEIMYSCDVCAFKCSSYSKLEVHLNTVHPKNPAQNSALSNTTSSASGMLGHRSGQIIPNFGIIVLGSDENENEKVAHEFHLHFRSNAIITKSNMIKAAKPSDKDGKLQRCRVSSFKGYYMIGMLYCNL